jgi:hypothetical protein
MTELWAGEEGLMKRRHKLVPPPRSYAMGWWMLGRQFIALRPAYQHAAEVVYDEVYPDCGGRSLQAWAARRWLVTKRLARWLAWRDAMPSTGART